MNSQRRPATTISYITRGSERPQISDLEFFGRLAHQTCVEQGLNHQQKAFFYAHWMAESEYLSFSVEPWSPQALVHQRQYNNPVLGNTMIGDDQRFRARGHARMVGRDVYRRFSDFTQIDCLIDPDRVLDRLLRYKSWEWLWIVRGGQQAADHADTDFERSSQQFLGYVRDHHSRQSLYRRNLKHLRRGDDHASIQSP